MCLLHSIATKWVLIIFFLAYLVNTGMAQEIPTITEGIIVLESKVTMKEIETHLTTHDIHYLVNTAIANTLINGTNGLKFNIFYPSSYLPYFPKKDIKFGWRYAPGSDFLNEYNKIHPFEYDTLMDIASDLESFTPLFFIEFERAGSEYTNESLQSPDYFTLISVSDFYLKDREIFFFMKVLTKLQPDMKYISNDLIIVQATHCKSGLVIIKSLTSALGWFFPDTMKTHYPKLEIPSIMCND